jgi:hypothetical protein
MSIGKGGPEKFGQSPKKKLLATLVTSLLQDLDGEEKKALLQEVVASGGDNPQVIDMVEH